MPKALDVLVKSLPAALPNCDSVTDGWLQWPLGQFIADHGRDHFDASMAAMVELTQRFSSEFAVRPFVEEQPDATFAHLLKLTDHPSPHVRRWCSEGTRPRLPWGKKLRALVDDPDPIWPILDALRADPERYVQRSVSNNLNDIAKDHPAAVVARCRDWAKRSPPVAPSLIRHALRTLIKDGHADALAAVGYGPPRGITATLSIQPPRIAIGGEVTLVTELSNGGRKAVPVMVDYEVHYVRSGGKSSAKVFKWTQAEVPGAGDLRLEKRHAMRRTTVRALYPGRHEVWVQVNGHRLAQASFTLKA